MLPAASGGDFAPTAEQDSGRRLILGAQRVNGSAEQDVVVQVEVRGEGSECEAWSTQGSNGSWARLVVGGGGGPPCRRAELPLVPAATFCRQLSSVRSPAVSLAQQPGATAL